MKKVSVQFNLVVDDKVTHKRLTEWLRDAIEYDECKITNIQINNTEKRGKR